MTNAQRRFLHADRLGSVVAVTDYRGNLLAANAYDEYGVPDANNLGRFGYTGQAWVPELGMFYYKARMYSPTLGRFMQTDPIGYADGMNMYAYVGGDPVNGVDPSGMAGNRPGDTCTGSRTRRPSSPGGCGSFGPGGLQGLPQTPLNSRSPGGLGGGGGGDGRAGEGNTNPNDIVVTASPYNPYQPTPGSAGAISGIGLISGDYILVQASTSRPWGSADFVYHYHFGLGSTVDLGNIGLGEVFENHPTVQTAINAIRAELIEVRGNRQGGIYYAQHVYNMTDTIFSLGNGILLGAMYCQEGLCSFAFSIRDRFTDPYDIFDWFDGDYEDGTPYDIVYRFGRP